MHIVQVSTEDEWTDMVMQYEGTLETETVSWREQAMNDSLPQACMNHHRCPIPQNSKDTYVYTVHER